MKTNDKNEQNQPLQLHDVGDSHSDIKTHINKRIIERDLLQETWGFIEKLNQETAFSMDCYRELQARFSSKLAYIDKSIQDHNRLL
jgi:hypothetical protein